MEPHLQSLILLRIKSTFIYSSWPGPCPNPCALCTNFIILGFFTDLEGAFQCMQVFYTSCCSVLPWNRGENWDLGRWESYIRPQVSWCEFRIKIRLSGHHPLFILLYWRKIMPQSWALSLEFRPFSDKHWQPACLQASAVKSRMKWLISNTSRDHPKACTVNLCCFEKLYLPSINSYTCPREKKSSLPWISRPTNQKTSLGKHVLIQMESWDSFLRFLVLQYISWVFCFQLILSPLLNELFKTLVIFTSLGTKFMFLIYRFNPITYRFLSFISFPFLLTSKFLDKHITM